MKNFRRVTALLLVLCMCLSFASAAETTEEHTHGIVSEYIDESVSSGIQEIENTDTSEPEQSDQSENTDLIEDVADSGVATTPADDTTEQPDGSTDEDGILHANLIEDPSGGRMTWELDDGTLWIGGSGLVKPISSADDQPWGDVRDQITAVRFCSDAYLIIESIAYWFSDCVNLTYAEVPAYAFSFGDYTFLNCTKLEELALYHAQDPEFTDTTFAGTGGVDIFVYVNGSEALTAVQNANWHGRSIDAIDLSEYPTTTYATCGINGCSCSSCSWYIEYDAYSETQHIKYEQCDSCSANEYAYGIRSDHTFSGGVCTICGYEESVEECDHSRSYYEWEGCTYYEYCYYCDEYLGYGVEHGTYEYGEWVYYSSSQHRRTKTCSDCGESSYTYGSHGTTTQYTNYSDTQHAVTQYCSTCSSTVGSTSYANHTLTYTIWSPYSDTQHQRIKRCSYCDLSVYEYGDHVDSNGSGACDVCPYEMAITITWDASTNGGTVGGSNSVTTSATSGATATAPSDTPFKTGHVFTGWFTAIDGGSLYNTITIHTARTFYAQFAAASYTITFDPGEGSTETTTKTVTYGDTYGELPVPTRGGYTFDGWFTAEEGGTQITADTEVDITANQTVYAHWTRLVSFSVTVPATLPIVVDEDGGIHTTTASIINNSTGAVQVSSVSLSALNGWNIVPYSMNAAQQKVDANLIGFSIQDAETVSTGNAETLSLPSVWSISEGSSLDLTYNAVVTALSQPVSDLNVLSVIFILEWAEIPQ